MARPARGRTPWGSSTPETIASTETPGSLAGFGSSTDDSVTGGAIDPTKYAYWVELKLPFTWSYAVTLDVRAQAVVIEHSK